MAGDNIAYTYKHDHHGDLHTLPVRDLVDHDTTRSCWCQPRVRRLCPECAGEDPRCFDCWRCGGSGWVEPVEDAPALVVHNAADGRA